MGFDLRLENGEKGEGNLRQEDTPAPRKITKRLKKKNQERMKLMISRKSSFGVCNDSIKMTPLKRFHFFGETETEIFMGETECCLTLLQINMREE